MIEEQNRRGPRLTYQRNTIAHYRHVAGNHHQQYTYHDQCDTAQHEFLGRFRWQPKHGERQEHHNCKTERVHNKRQRI